MAEFKSLNGYDVKDAKAREDISKLNSDLNDPLSSFDYISVNKFCGINSEASEYVPHLVGKTEYYVIIGRENDDSDIFPIHFLRCKQFPNASMESIVGMGWNGNGYYGWKGGLQLNPTNGLVLLRTEYLGSGTDVDSWRMGIRGVYYK